MENAGDKRKYKRFKKEVEIHFEMITAMGDSPAIPDSGDSRSINVSMGGVLFETKKPIPVSSIIECQFHIAGFKEPIYAKAKIVRVEELYTNKYDLGIQFIAISDDDRKVLEKYITA